MRAAGAYLSRVESSLDYSLRSQAGSKIEVEYSLPPERDHDGYRRGPSKVYAKVPQGTVATTVASDWAATGAGVWGAAALRLLGATARAPHLSERAVG